MLALTKSRHLNVFPLFSINFKVCARKSTTREYLLKLALKVFFFESKRKILIIIHASRACLIEINEVNSRKLALCHSDVNYFLKGYQHEDYF